MAAHGSTQSDGCQSTVRQHSTCQLQHPHSLAMRCSTGSSLVQAVRVTRIKHVPPTCRTCQRQDSGTSKHTMYTSAPASRNVNYQAIQSCETGNTLFQQPVNAGVGCAPCIAMPHDTSSPSDLPTNTASCHEALCVQPLAGCSNTPHMCKHHTAAAHCPAQLLTLQPTEHLSSPPKNSSPHNKICTPCTLAAPHPHPPASSSVLVRVSAGVQAAHAVPQHPTTSPTPSPRHHTHATRAVHVLPLLTHLQAAQHSCTPQQVARQHPPCSCVHKG